MGLKNMSIQSGATIGPTGGTAKVFADDGITVQNGLHVNVPATADYRVRESATWKFKPPTLQPDGSYAKDKKSVVLVVPQIIASGKVVYNLIRIEREVHPELSAGGALDLNVLAAQLLCDADATAFWAAGSVS